MYDCETQAVSTCDRFGPVTGRAGYIGFGRLAELLKRSGIVKDNERLLALHIGDGGVLFRVELVPSPNAPHLNLKKERL